MLVYLRIHRSNFPVKRFNFSLITIHLSDFNEIRVIIQIFLNRESELNPLSYLFQFFVSNLLVMCSESLICFPC